MIPQWHAARLTEQIRIEVEEIVAGELKDPRIGLVTVNAVQLSADLRHAHVLVMAEGNDEEQQKTLEGLSSSAGFVGHEVGRRLNLRHAPEILFVFDRGAEAVQRVEEVLQKLNEQK